MTKPTTKKNRAQEVVQASPTQSMEISLAAWVTARWKIILQTLIILSAGLWIYWPVLHGEWLFDDDVYITHNPLLYDSQRLWKTWFLPGALLNYFPITFSLQYFQWLVWGNDTFGYHLTNVLLHITNSLLLWKLFSKLHLRFAWLGACLFLAYPIQVESVAWISEFKSTVSLGPFLISLIFLCEYRENRRSHDLILSVILYIVAMLCKTNMAMFPLALLTYEWWKKRSIDRSDLLTTFPYFVSSLFLGAITLFTGKWYDQRYHFHWFSSNSLGLPERVVLAGQVICFYLLKIVWPFSPSFLYPRWSVAITPLEIAPLVILLLFALFLLRKTTLLMECVTIGVGWFVIMALPFVDLISTGNMPFTWVMDHFLYVPIIGPIGAFIKLCEVFREHFSGTIKSVGFSIAFLSVTAMAECSHSYAKQWVSHIALFTPIVERWPQSWAAHYDLGIQFAQHPATLSKGLSELEIAIQEKPDRADLHASLGDALFQVPGRINDAIAEFQKSLELDAAIPEVHLKLAQALEQVPGQESKARNEIAQFWKGSPNDALHHNECGLYWADMPGHSMDAISEYEKAIDLYPDYAEAHLNMGLSLASLPGQLPNAIHQFQEAIRIQPHYAPAESNLANAFMETGRIEEAVPYLRKAIQDDPTLDAPHYQLAMIYIRVLGGREQAISELRKALICNPLEWHGHYMLGTLLALDPDRYQDAISEYQAALSINPNVAETHNMLGVVLAKVPGQRQRAISEFQAALQINPNFSIARDKLNLLLKQSAEDTTLK